MTVRGRHPRPTARRSPEAGETLVETLIAVTLMGLAVVGILGGLLSLIRVSDEVDDTTRSGNGAQAVAERLKQPVDDMEYVPCAGTGTYASTLASVLPPGFTATVTSVEHGKATAASSSSSPGSISWAASCGDAGLQRITVTVAPTDDPTDTEVVRVIKRDARCVYSSAYSNLDNGPC